MINTRINNQTFQYEETVNEFYLTQTTTELDDGVAITIETPITCRPLSFALKAGDKIKINGASYTINADAAVDATTFFVDAVTLEQSIEFGSRVVIDQDNMFQQYQRKTEGTVAGFTIDSDGIAKGGVEITGWLDSDTMSGATANNVPTAESVKAYVDSNAASSNFIMGTCSATVETSVTAGVANAVAIPFDTTFVTASSPSVSLYGASGVTGVSGSAYSFKLDAAATEGIYEISWNIATNTSVVNNRYLCGITLESGLTEDASMTWEEYNPSRTWMYNRGTGGNRYASAGNSVLYTKVAESSIRVFRLVFWKEDGNASGKLITEINGCSITIKQL